MLSGEMSIPYWHESYLAHYLYALCRKFDCHSKFLQFGFGKILEPSHTLCHSLIFFRFTGPGHFRHLFEDWITQPGKSHQRTKVLLDRWISWVNFCRFSYFMCAQGWCGQCRDSITLWTNSAFHCTRPFWNTGNETTLYKHLKNYWSRSYYFRAFTSEL